MQTTLILAESLTHLLISEKDIIAIPADSLLYHIVEECKDGQREEETDIEEPYDLEIVKQSAFDHFNATLQRAQRLAAQAEKENTWKHPRRYSGKSKRTLKRHIKVKENHTKMEFLPLFEFLAQMKKRALEKEHMLEKELAIENSGLMSKHVGQVHCRAVMMVRN